MKINYLVISSSIILFTAFLSNAAPSAPISNENNVASQVQREEGSNKPNSSRLNEKLNAKVDEVSEGDYQKIVEEYKNYLKTVPPAVRQEIREYRKEIVRINKQKTETYKKLSQEAQDFLAKERATKKKLPIHNKKQFAKDIHSSESE